MGYRFVMLDQNRRTEIPVVFVRASVKSLC